VQVATVDAFGEDVHDLAALRKLAASLTQGSKAQPAAE
jgi:hypothetical protein